MSEKPLKFGGLQKTSLIDFPNKISSVLFTAGCNLRCPFCHNWRLVLEPQGPFLAEDQVLQVLESRKRHVKAVVITGGEPTTQKDLPKFLAELKERGFAVKLDTNGFFPDALEECLPYLDYVALDLKTSLEKYDLLGARSTESFVRTVEMLKQGKVDYEFRTTVVPGFVDAEDIPKIGELAKDAKCLVLQQFIPDDTLDKTFHDVKPYSPEVIACFADIMKKYVNSVMLRV
jgi:pyruvate formate lyase activating enzyme